MSKLLNDPVYGFINIPRGLIYDIIEHPYFQRLRRIKQLGLTDYIYPGAVHSRFHHALGAFHLMTCAIQVLRNKGTEITDEEALAVSCAILMHDIGHGPFSHALEHRLMQVHHEELTLLYMHKMNEEFGGKLDMAIEIFTGKYHKKFLYQLISGQLDMDRLDYLTRDSFFTGVYEGVVGYDRIIQMLAVHEDRLVVEEKGIYSIEKFLIARRLMYWQAYLHKTALCAELMFVSIMEYARKYIQQGGELPASPALSYFLKNNISSKDLKPQSAEIIKMFSKIDDFDVISALKMWMDHDDPVISKLSTGIINRRLFKVETSIYPIPEEKINTMKKNVMDKLWLSEEQAAFMVLDTTQSNSAYAVDKDEILILFKNGTVMPVSSWPEHNIGPLKVTKYFFCYPRELAEKK